MAKTFRSWSVFAANAQLQRRTVERFRWQMENRSAAAAFRTWAQLSSDRKSVRGLLQRMWGKWHNRELSHGFVVWRQYVTASDHDTFVSALQMEVERLKSELGALTESNAKLESRFEQQHSTLVAKVVGRMQNTAMSGAFSQWRENVAEAKRLRGVMARFSAQMANRTLASAYRAWEEWSSRRIAERRLIKRVAARFQNRHMAAMYSSWTDYVADRKSARSLIVRLVLRSANKELGHGFVVWMRATQAAAERAQMSSHEAALAALRDEQVGDCALGVEGRGNPRCGQGLLPCTRADSSPARLVAMGMVAGRRDACVGSRAPSSAHVFISYPLPQPCHVTTRVCPGGAAQLGVMKAEAARLVRPPPPTPPRPSLHALPCLYPCRALLQGGAVLSLFSCWCHARRELMASLRLLGSSMPFIPR